MSGSKLYLGVLLVVALVVALEEWRIAGWRGRANKAEQDLELALAEQPPPPRPEEAGAHNSVIGASRIRRIKDRNEDRMAGGAEGGGAEPVVAVTEGGTEPVEGSANDPPAEAGPVDYTASANAMYSALVDKFKLNETERAYFVQLMAEGMKFQDEQAVALAAAEGPDEQAAVVRKLAEAERVFGQKVHHFLGNDRDFEIYQAYVQKLAEQIAVEAGGGGQ
jgi:hypothetical protein